MSRTLDIKELVELLKKENNIIVSSHISPDSDAIGSAVGLAEGLKILGKNVVIYFQDLIPKRHLNLLGEIKIVHGLAEIDFSVFETLVVVDTASKKRVGKAVDQIISNVKKSYNIDHHVSNDLWAEINYIQSSAAASAVIVWQILKLLSVEVTPLMANLLYAGVLDDTGKFCYSNTNAQALECATELLHAGAIPSFVYRQLYGTVPLNKLKLQAFAIANLKILDNGKVAFLSVDTKTLNTFSTEADDTDGLVELIRAIDGVEISVFQRELELGVWKFSLRSKREDIDLNQITSLFGGGGHRAAAGCKLDGSREETESKVLAAVSKVISELMPRETK